MVWFHSLSFLLCLAGALALGSGLRRAVPMTRWPATAVLGALALGQAGFVLRAWGPGFPGAASFLDLGSSALLAWGTPALLGGLGVWPGRRSLRWTLGFLGAVLAGGAGAAAAWGQPLGLRICLWAGLGSLLLLPVLRDRLVSADAVRLWRRLFLVVLPALPLVVLVQVGLLVPSLAVLRSVLSGTDFLFLGTGLSAVFLTFRAEGTAAGPPGLSPREAEIAGLLAEGLSYKEIAGRLGLAYKTVDHHIQNLYRKAGVGTRHALLAKLRPGG